ncbi:unnamed protein product [Caenorhabditis sp. 36 PRJEB53466]|nr:unnamed protein product [Caenorhabditis sp. 36 PRJEB53466]
MYQLDSWYAVLFELILVGFSLYNSLRMTKWWSTVAEGTSIGIHGARNVPSVADYYGIRTENTTGERSCGKRRPMSPEIGEMGDGIKLH